MGMRNEGSWARFEVRLAAFCSTMLDPRDRLRLHLPALDPDGPMPRLEIATSPAGLTVTVGGAGGADPLAPGGPEQVAERVCATLAAHRTLLHPTLLTYDAEGPAAPGAAILALTPSAGVGDDVVREVPTLVALPDAAGLRALLVDHLGREVDPQVGVDPDGDVRFTYRGLEATHGEIGGYFRVPENEPVPVIGLFSVLLHSVTSPRADLELNVLNRAYRWSRWVRYGQHVVQEMSIPAAPFDPDLVDVLTHVFFADLVHVVVDLADRVDGTMTT